MPTTGNTSIGSSRKPLQEYNGRLANGDVLRSIPEGKKTDIGNNVSHAICVKDGIGHDVVDDPLMEADNGELIVVL